MISGRKRLRFTESGWNKLSNCFSIWQFSIKKLNFTPGGCEEFPPQKKKTNIFLFYHFLAVRFSITSLNEIQNGASQTPDLCL